MSEALRLAVEEFSRGWHELLGRDSGLLHVRLISQPLVATMLGTRAGWRDGRTGRPVFFWTLVQEPTQRRLLLREALRDVGRLDAIGETAHHVTRTHPVPRRV